MSRKGGKVSVVQKTMKDPELIDMFNKMMGASEPDPGIVVPKYERIHGNASDIIQMLAKFTESKVSIVLADQFPKGLNDIREFVKKSMDALKNMELAPNDNILSGEELRAINTNPEKLQEFFKNMNSPYKVQNLGEKYTKLRESFVIKEMIMIARNLKNTLIAEQKRSRTETHDLEKKESLRDGFILNSDGDYLTLFNFTPLDFKQMWYSDLLNEQHKKYILYVLHLIYIRVIIIVKDITSPDIDTDKFSEVVVRNIDDMRKHIPRCDKAFDKIKESVGLLKDNFGEYYKDFVTSQNANPGIIVENFVVDVAKRNTADLTTTRQFREIIRFYNQQISGKKVSDPRVRKMLSLVGENMDILENKLESKTTNEKSEEIVAPEKKENPVEIKKSTNGNKSGTPKKSRNRRNKPEDN